jgi:hypothetical protein
MKPDTTERALKVRGKQIACFHLCQNIGLRLEDEGRSISAAGINFELFSGSIVSSLETLKLFIDYSLKQIRLAKDME